MPASLVNSDQVIAKMPGQHRAYRKNAVTCVANGYHSMFLTAGDPGTGVAPTTLTGAFPEDSDNGFLKFDDPAGSLKTYLAKLSGKSSKAPATLVLYDRIWHNKLDLSITTAQTVTWPAVGTQRHTDGKEVELFAEIYTVLANTTAATWTVVYNDQDGNSRTATLDYATSAIAGRMIPFNTPGNGPGCQRVTSCQVSVVQASGTMGFVMARRIGEIALGTIGKKEIEHFFQTGLTEVKNSAALAVMLECGSDTSTGDIAMRHHLIQA